LHGARALFNKHGRLFAPFAAAVAKDYSWVVRSGVCGEQRVSVDKEQHCETIPWWALHISDVVRRVCHVLMGGHSKSMLGKSTGKSIGNSIPRKTKMK
jgi:hypothetical protein